MKSTQGNIHTNSNTIWNAQNTLARGLDTKINTVRDYFLKHSLIQENFQEEKKERISLLKLKKGSRQYGHIPTFVIDPCSSGEESDIEDEKMNEATIRDVANTLIDLNTIMIVKNIEEFPKEARPCLLFQNLDEWITPLYVKLFVEDSPCFMTDENQPKIEEVKILKYKNLTFALVVFQKLADCVKLYKYFEHPNKKKLAPSKNTKGGLIEIYLSYDLHDLTLSYWYGVVLRNLPNNCTQGNVKTFCENQVNGLLYVLYPMKIKTSYCSIAIVKELDDAEKLSVAVNNKEVVKNKRIKAHVHPRSCKIRRDTDKSHFLKLFVNNKISFGKAARESSSLIHSHTTLTKLKIFQTNQAKVESEKTNSVRENHSTNPVINILDKPQDNVKSVSGSGKLSWKNTEKPAGKEKDMYTSLLSMLSIPSKEKQEPVLLTAETNNTSLVSSAQVNAEDDAIDNSQFNLMKLPFLSNLNLTASRDNILLGNIKDSSEVNKSELIKAPACNKEIKITKTTKKASNNTIPLMSSIGEMLKLINKNQSNAKLNEIQGDSIVASGTVEKIIQKTQIETNNIELLKEETVSKPSEENKVGNFANTSENLNKNEIINLIDESEELYSNEYYLHDFKDKTFYEKPRMVNSYSRLTNNKPEYRPKINIINESDDRLETQDNSRFKKYNNTNVRMHNNNNNSDSTPKFNNLSNNPSQSEQKEKEMTNYNYQINQSNFSQSYPYKNTNYNKNRIPNNNYASSNTNLNNQNYRNSYNCKNTQDFIDTNPYSIRTINQPIKQAIDISLNSSAYLEAINGNNNNKSTDKNMNQNSKERCSNNLIDIAPSNNKSNILPPLPTTQPPEPEIRNLSILESVVVLESNEEPGQIIILSPDEEEKTKSEIRLLSSTNSEDNTDKKYVGTKRSRSRERTRDYHKDYKDRSNSRRSSHFRENNERSSHVRKDYRRDSNEYQSNREYSNHDRHHRESKDYNEKKYYTERNRNSRYHRASPRSSSSDVRSPNSHNSGLYMKKFHERTQTISLTSTSASTMNKKYSSQPDEENLDSREKQLKYK